MEGNNARWGMARRGARKAGAIFSINLQNAFVYRANVVSGICFYTLFIFVFFSLWRAIYKEGDIGGLSLNQIVWYLCVTELVSFGCRGRVFSEISDEVKSGSIAYHLTRPYGYITYKLATALGASVYNIAVFGLMAVALGMVFVGPIPGYNPVALPFAALSLLLGMLLQFFTAIALGLTALIFEENSGFNLLYGKLVFMLGTFLPLEFLPGWLRSVARCLPFSYVTWAPARLFVDFSFSLFFEVVPVQIFWIAVMALCAARLYRAGVKRLQAQGG